MADCDPEILLEWLQMGSGEMREIQHITLEQLCMLLLMSDDVDRVLKLVCTGEFGAVFTSGGLNCVLQFIWEHGCRVHKDTLNSCMSVVTELCGEMEPKDSSQQECVSSLSALLHYEDHLVSDGSLPCFASLADRFTRKGEDPAPLAA
ncbi:HECD1-like protein [Mya arenaria]|uniref:E3 ubiquitin-protein ligase n=1 Tax=Mya arenaria TaxID=6604 RepID=A0ABY7FZ29_MYAAR|nr:HECD1-like protein [Mya arenaria]